MARYRDLHTAAQNYGSVYRQGLAQRESSQKEAGNQMLSFAEDITELVERQKQREAAEAESAALERQRKAQRRLWEHQAQADNKRLGLEGKRLGLEGSRVSLQGKQVDIQAAQHRHRKSHDEKTLKQQGVEASDLKLYRSKVEERESLKANADIYFKKLDAVEKRIAEFRKEEEYKKWKRGSLKETNELWDANSETTREGLDAAIGSNNRAQIRTAIIRYKDMLQAMDGVDIEKIPPPEELSGAVLDRYTTLIDKDKWMKEQINPGYKPTEKPAFFELRDKLLAHPIWSPLSDKGKAQRQLLEEVKNQNLTKITPSVPTNEDLKNESFLDGFDDSVEVVTEDGTSPKLLAETLESKPDPKEKNAALEEAPLAVQNRLDFSTLYSDFSDTNPWLKRVNNVDKYMAVGEIVNAIHYASTKGSTKADPAVLETKFNSLTQMNKHLKSAAEADPSTETGKGQKAYFYQQAFNEWADKSNRTWVALEELKTNGDEIARNFLDNIEHLLTKVDDTRTRVYKELDESKVTRVSHGESLNSGQLADQLRDKYVSKAWELVKSGAKGIWEGLVWYKDFHNEAYSKGN